VVVMWKVSSANERTVVIRFVIILERARLAHMTSPGAAPLQEVLNTRVGVLEEPRLTTQHKDGLKKDVLC